MMIKQDKRRNHISINVSILKYLCVDQVIDSELPQKNAQVISQQCRSQGF